MASRMAGKQQPFAYVNAQPDMRTPAGQGGMLLGDAILQLGDACHLGCMGGLAPGNAGSLVPLDGCRGDLCDGWFGACGLWMESA